MAQKVGIGTILVIEAKSAADARSQINESELQIGNGDRNKLIAAILNHELPQTIPDLFGKLLLVASQPKQERVFCDKFKKADPNTFTYCRRTAFQLWLHLYRRHKVFGQQEILTILGAKHAENVDLWCRFVDENGKTTLRPKEYIEFRL